jgi:hemolysin III
MYHSRVDVKSKHFWRIVDHISIFLLIGCSYTAYLLIFLKNGVGMNFLKIQWLLIMAGILFKLIFKDRFEYFSLILYLILGWRVIHIFHDVTEKMNFDTKFFLFMGGIAYSIGVVFYAWENLRFNHAIWHLFVLLGSYSHLLALWLM